MQWIIIQKRWGIKRLGDRMDILEAIATYEKCLTAARRLWGAGHPQVTGIERHLEKAREALAAPKSARFKRALKRVRKD